MLKFWALPASYAFVLSYYYFTLQLNNPKIGHFKEILSFKLTWKDEVLAS